MKKINRGEISKIFGELFFAVDPGYRGVAGEVPTQYANIRADERLEMLANLNNEEKEAEAIARMSALNVEIAATEGLDENYQIGASYFLKLKNIDFDRLWSDYLHPLLQEYINGMELIRHTVESIKHKPYGHKLLAQAKDEVKAVVAATPNYDMCNRQKIIDANKTNTIRHAYYREYRELQNLCLLILQHQKHQIGMGSKKVYGLLFDGAWLWEEYMNSIVDEFFYHPMNKATKGSQHLFDHNRGLIYPDFISRDSEARVIADAKYKPIDNIGNKDYLQVLAYMFRFDAKKGFYFYPEMGEEEDAVMWLNRGSTYEKNVEVREDICLIKHGFQIPTGIDVYSAFTEQMRCNEIKFLDGILISMK